ncbi:MAG TPA: Uma2 family endonuclease [Pyrinomonadaceae bacterium]|nr:Uma2 family endonuclease [Pyrinomonadaceae bacterium]
MSVQIARRHFNVTEYYRMTEAGILSESDRVELIDGEVIEMSPIGSRHAACVNRLTMLLTGKLGQTAILSVQNPIRLDEYSEPQPDLCLLQPRSDFYAEGHPTPVDVLLVVEVADSSVGFDREVKLPLYAQVLIRELWLVNLQADVVEIYSQPSGGKYQKSREVKRGEVVKSETIQQLSLDASHVLG